jgi:hypothetical protein
MMDKAPRDICGYKECTQDYILGHSQPLRQAQGRLCGAVRLRLSFFVDSSQILPRCVYPISMYEIMPRLQALLIERSFF